MGGGTPSISLLWYKYITFDTFLESPGSPIINNHFKKWKFAQIQIFSQNPVFFSKKCAKTKRARNINKSNIFKSPWPIKFKYL